MNRTDDTKGEYRVGASEQEDSLNNARAMIGWDKPIEIEDDSDLKKYRIELPNLYDDAGLDPYELRLLVHYKRVGTCTESTRTTAKICKMSTGQVSQKRMSLHKKKFILVQKVQISPDKEGIKIRVLDRWQENFTKYTPRSPHEQPRSPHETKKEQEAVNLFEIYQSEIGVITSYIADSIEDWEKVVSPKWIADAMHEAAANNKRNWKYCEAILKRWKAQGNQDSAKKNGNGNHPEPVNDMDDIERILR